MKPWKLPENYKELVLLRCQEIDSRVMDGYDWNMHHTGNSVVELICNIDGHAYHPTFRNFLKYKTKCPKCNGSAKLTVEEQKCRILSECEARGYSVAAEFDWNSITNNASYIPLICSIE